MAQLPKYHFPFPPEYLFILFSLINFLNYLDRGIIPGASEEFNDFIRDSLNTNKPDVYLGLLQSAFVAGFSISSVIFGHIVHYYSPFSLISIGLFIWIVSVTLSGLSKPSGSYFFLLFARTLSGIGEASFISLVPPIITDHAKPGKDGFWLGIFFTCIPVGIACGYIYGAGIANSSLGWSFAFYLEALLMTPLCIAFLILSKYLKPINSNNPNDNNNENMNNNMNINNEKINEPLLLNNNPNENIDHITSDNILITSDDILSRRSYQRLSEIEHIKDLHQPTWLDELKILLNSWIFISLTLGYAAYTGVLIGISTFGSSMLLSLDYYDNETSSSFIFGVLISVAGILGTPLGGMIQDLNFLGDNEDEEGEIWEEINYHEEWDEEDHNYHYIYEDNDNNNNNEKENNDNIISNPLIDNMNNIDNNIIERKKSKRRKKIKKKQEELDIVSNRKSSLDINSAENFVIDHKKRVKVIAQCFLWCTIGTAIVIAVPFFYNRELFLFGITIGTFFLMMPSAGINSALMLSVPPENRPFALAFSAFCLHAFGDVPSPTIIGLIKDSLAPDCAGSDDDVDDDIPIAASEDCRDESNDIRLTFLITALWLLWCVIFYLIALLLAKRAKHRFGTKPHHSIPPSINNI